MIDEQLQTGETVPYDVVTGIDDPERQLWVLVQRRPIDPFDLIEGFEIGSELSVCRGVRGDGSLVLETGTGSENDLMLPLLQRDSRDQA